MTPLGDEVDPEVYCRSATVLLSISGSLQLLLAPFVISRVSMYANLLSPAAWLDSVLDKRALLPVRQRAGSQSDTIPESFSILREERAGEQGTAITPAYRQPRNAQIYSIPEGNRTSARLP